MDELKAFMKGRPYDKDVNFEKAVIEYIEQVEEMSVKRYKELDKLIDAHLDLAKENDELIQNY